ncbi:MAG: hypothetical protein EOO61_10965, partial [Hymenobacter sp.]
LGADFYARVIEGGVRKMKGAPTAQKTSFGWIVFGGYSDALCHASVVNTAQAGITNDQLLHMMTNFFEYDKVPKKSYCTQEEHLCEQIFTNHITTDITGRYIARMPLQPNAPAVIDTYQLAYGRLMQMEKRFNRDPLLKENYTKFMREYIELGHMVLVPAEEERSATAVYIPHHAAGTSKFRTVFDGSCKRIDGVSINDIQLNGEKVQPELTTTLMRFRMNKIALTADIAKMYRQILIAEDQQDLQRILWRESPSDPIREYRLVTQTYGMKSAAYVCIKCLDHCANEFTDEFPDAAKAVKESFYVDDMLGGADSVESAKKLYDDLTTMLGRRKLELAKWSTNDPEVLEYIKNDGAILVELNKEETNAVVGMHWSPSADAFVYKIKNPIRSEKPTKRSIASDIARLFDPCGYLGCIVVNAKVLIQKLWRSKIDWDEEVTGELLNEWLEICNQLPKIEEIRIPRWIGTTKRSQKQLHGFADASCYAYGCEFYLRQEDESGNVNVHLIYAKSRVAPTKGSTIPKLELSACHLMAQLVENIRIAHDINANECILWSDSMITLHWIKKSPVKLDVFVGGRVGEIQELTKEMEWRHVETKCNPGDIISRGINAGELVHNQLWWHGPD